MDEPRAPEAVGVCGLTGADTGAEHQGALVEGEHWGGGTQGSQPAHPTSLQHCGNLVFTQGLT